MDKAALPNKPYFRIGEVAELLGVETHVLRYWEAEFPQLSPTRAPSGQRLYRRPDVEKLVLVRRLLHQEGYTIAGARRRLEEMEQAPGAPPQAGSPLAPPAPRSDQGRLFPPPTPETPGGRGSDRQVVAEVVAELKNLLRRLS